MRIVSTRFNLVPAMSLQFKMKTTQYLQRVPSRREWVLYRVPTGARRVAAHLDICRDNEELAARTGLSLQYVIQMKRKLDCSAWTWDELNVDVDADVANCPLEWLNIELRLGNTLMHSGVSNLATAFSMKDVDLLEIPNFGNKCLKDLRTYEAILNGKGCLSLSTHAAI